MALLTFFAGALAADLAGAPAPFLFAAQRAFIIAASLARPSGDIPPFFFATGAGLSAAGAAFSVAPAVPLTLAQRARVEAAILARASADMTRLPAFGAGLELVEVVVLGEAAEEPPKMEASSAFSFSIFSAISTARLSCPTDGVLLGMGRGVAGCHVSCNPKFQEITPLSIRQWCARRDLNPRPSD